MENKEKVFREIKGTLSIAIPYIVALFAVWFCLNFIVLRSVIASCSMEPTINTGEIIWASRISYIIKAPQRGDIVVFYCEEMGEEYLKRVIGTEGDSISFEDGYIFINNLKVDESDYLSADIETYSTKTFIVPPGHVFVLGDNRENSYDSRYLKNPYIPIDEIKGKYIGKSLLSHLNKQ